MAEKPAPAPAAWSRAEVEELLRKESFRYQAVPLPHGLATPGHDRAATADLIFPADLGGQSVLDVGCSLGYFCFEARRRGADHVLGVDLDPENVRKARLLAGVKGERVEFERRDAELEPIEETFDNVICLNVLHHLLDPILGVDRLVALARRRLVLEVATFGAHDRKKLGMSRLEQLLVERLPVMVVGSGAVSEGIKQFYFTRSSIKNLLRFRRGCFASVEVVPSDFKGRFIAIAEKRRIADLLVTAGPLEGVAAGLADRFLSGELGSLPMELAAPPRWGPRLAAARYHEQQPAEQARLIFEYDFLRPFASGAGTFDHDPAVEVAGTAGRVSFLTAWLPPDALRSAMESAHRAATGRARKRIERVLEACRDDRRVTALYRDWFAWTRTAYPEAPHVVVGGVEGERTFVTPAEWESSVG